MKLHKFVFISDQHFIFVSDCLELDEAMQAWFIRPVFIDTDENFIWEII